METFKGEVELEKKFWMGGCVAITGKTGGRLWVLVFCGEYGGLCFVLMRVGRWP